MPRVTKELLRKRAEHNEGLLTTLEEVSLHQQDLERIENFEVYCRHLKILYLQSNLIPKMENLNKLKELEYINLAVNNISKIEGVRGCESLAKLDLTLNFIDIEDLEESIENLSECESIQDLYLTGNPCESWPDFKEYVMAKIVQLKRLDGEEISKSQRLAARQKLKQMERDLKIAAEENIIKKQIEAEKGDNENGYTKESRVKMYEEMQEQKKQEEAKNSENSMFKEFNDFEQNMKKKEPVTVYNQFGDIRQCNEGKYDFAYSETTDKTCVILEFKVPKFLDTSLVNVDLNPQYVRIEIKGKITQLKHPDEIIVEKSKIQRSQITGVLQLTMPKQNISEVEARNMRIQQIKEDKEKQDKLKKLEQEQREAKLAQKKGMDEYSKKAMEQKDDKSYLIRESKKKSEEEKDGETKNMFIPDFDESDVPPLE